MGNIFLRLLDSEALHYRRERLEKKVSFLRIFENKKNQYFLNTSREVSTIDF